MMDEDMDEPADIVQLEMPETDAAPEGPVGTLSLRLLPAASVDAPPVTLHGYYNVDVLQAGRTGGVLPGAIWSILILRETGAVHAAQLLNNDEIPPRYDPDAGPTMYAGDDPSDHAGMSESGHFSTQLQGLIALPDAAATLDGFLWLEDLASEMAQAHKPARRSDVDLPPPGGIPADMSRVTAAPEAAGLRLTLDADATRLTGTAMGSRVTILAMALPEQRIGYTVLTLDDQQGLAFDVPVQALLPGLSDGARVLAFAVANGARSDLADSAGMP